MFYSVFLKYSLFEFLLNTDQAQFVCSEEVRHPENLSSSVFPSSNSNVSDRSFLRKPLRFYIVQILSPLWRKESLSLRISNFWMRPRRRPRRRPQRPTPRRKPRTLRPRRKPWRLTVSDMWSSTGPSPFMGFVQIGDWLERLRPDQEKIQRWILGLGVAVGLTVIIRWSLNSLSLQC